MAVFFYPALDIRSFLSDIWSMKGRELLRRLKRYGREAGIDVHYVVERGKGSHGTLYCGDRFAVIPDLKQELKAGTLRAILAQLGLTPDDLK